MVNLISVIVPVYNDEKGIKATVNSLLNQKCNSRYEIIIVDNNSTDETFAVARDLALSNPNIVRTFLENEIQSSYAARNHGIDKASGEVLCFIDADMTAESDYINKVNTYFLDKDLEYLACDVNVYSLEDTLAAKYNIANGFQIEKNVTKKHFCPTCSLCIQRSLVEKIGKFDQRLISSGDWEFGQRAYNYGIKLVYAPDITLHHPARTSFSSLLSKTKRIGRGVAQLIHYHPQYIWKKTRFYNPIYCVPNIIKLKKSFNKKNIRINFMSVFGVFLFVIYSRIIKFIYILKEEKIINRTES